MVKSRQTNQISADDKHSTSSVTHTHACVEWMITTANTCHGTPPRLSHFYSTLSVIMLTYTNHAVLIKHA